MLLFQKYNGNELAMQSISNQALACYLQLRSGQRGEPLYLLALM